MTGEQIAWAAVAAVLGQVLLAVGQVSPDLPVFMLQVISSAALAALVTCGIRRLQEMLAGTEPVPGPGGDTP
jgi:purine-cytosine permease-like protein